MHEVFLSLFNTEFLTNLTRLNVHSLMHSDDVLKNYIILKTQSICTEAEQWSSKLKQSLKNV